MWEILWQILDIDIDYTFTDYGALINIPSEDVVGFFEELYLIIEQAAVDLESEEKSVIDRLNEALVAARRFGLHIPKGRYESAN